MLSSYGSLNSLLAALRLPLIILSIFPPGRPRPRGRCRCRCPPSPPPGVRRSSRVSCVGWVGGKTDFGYSAVFMVVSSWQVLIGTVQYLGRCRVAVRCQRGFHRQIGTELIGSCSSTIQGLSVRVAVRLETYRFGWQYGASDRVGSHAYRREACQARMRIGTRSCRGHFAGVTARGLVGGQ